MNHAITTAFLSILSLSACSSGSSSDDQSTPLAAQAVSESLVLGLWQFESNYHASAESDGEIDYYAEYVEITDDNFTFFVTDGISNCYEANSFPISNISGNDLTIDWGDGDEVASLEATESKLFFGSTTTDNIDDDGNIVVVPIITYAKVENISSQDFNSCTF